MHVVLVALASNLVVSSVFIINGPYNMGKGSALGLASSSLLLWPRTALWFFNSRRAQCGTPAIYIFGQAPRVPNAIDPHIERLYRKEASWDGGPPAARSLTRSETLSAMLFGGAGLRRQAAEGWRAGSEMANQK
jgi:hypothetical protein